MKKIGRTLFSVIVASLVIWMIAVPGRAAFNTTTNVLAALGAYVDGAIVTLGAKADAVCGTAVGNCTDTALFKFANSTLSAINNVVSKFGTTYNTIAASQTNYVLSSTQGGATGATGDFLSLCVIMPATVNPGNVIIYDNTTAVYTFAGGASSVSTLISWSVPFSATSVSGGWKVTTGANVSAYCSGKFT